MSIIAKSLLVSFLISCGVFVVTPLAAWYYRDSGLYPSAEISTIRPDNDSNLLVVAVVFILLLWLKFFLYDSIGRSLLNTLCKRWATVWFTSIYVLGALTDITSLFLAAKPAVDAGFAALGIIMYTPVILLLGVAVLLVARIRYEPHK